MNRDQLLAPVFVEMADSLTEDFDVLEFLQRLCGHCMELLSIEAAGVMLADADDVLRVLAASDEYTRLLELFALQHMEGPCQECYRTGTPTTSVDLTTDKAARDWPNFTPAARQGGLAGANALPLKLRGRTIGVLGLFRASPLPLSADDLALGQALADVATIAVLQQRTIVAIETERDQLQHALHSRIAVEQAKGVLAERWNTTPDTAFQTLRAYARAHQQSLTALAMSITDGSFDARAIVPATASPTEAPRAGRPRPSGA
ncbi:GAF and ANTAR domain-containing protein [Streptomyces sp. SID14478]|uniref:GAF and ANTAR domain-containing protein n=1 Tax=Streptomyces sp. SID14478 TaxID=2706073 RepID=UPI0013DB9766|nr:GAF and ANTAR domain-containing protein [Streptomyces sp. SID14478]NEB76114.1 GAF and ANTAR domain-containing protein [Streptomyces sp. SID14478]